MKQKYSVLQYAHNNNYFLQVPETYNDSNKYIAVCFKYKFRNWNSWQNTCWLTPNSQQKGTSLLLIKGIFDLQTSEYEVLPCIIRLPTLVVLAQAVFPLELTVTLDYG